MKSKDTYEITAGELSRILFGQADEMNKGFYDIPELGGKVPWRKVPHHAKVQLVPLRDDHHQFKLVDTEGGWIADRLGPVLGARESKKVRTYLESAKRTATRKYWTEKYAKLLFAMSVPDALSILGFSQYAKPTSQEITKAYKNKAFENHPDRGGDPSRMVEINVAKDILENTAKQPVIRSAPKYDVVEVVKGASFDQAARAIPASVDWKLVSTPEWVSPQKAPFIYGTIWTFVGLKGGKWVVATLTRYDEHKQLDKEKEGFIVYEPNWTCRVTFGTNAKSPLKTISTLVKSINTEVPKKWNAWQDGALTETALVKRSRQGGFTLQDALLSADIVQDTAARKR